MRLAGKTILLGVTGGIAAYKTAYLASALKKAGANVHVLMTENAKQFVGPVTFETLTGNKCVTDTFDRNYVHNVEHVALAKQADLVLVAPATANVVGKLAHGIADDMLTTTVLACTCPKLIAPAMNTQMFENPVVQDNLQTLKNYGWTVIAPAAGYLACGDAGAGRMPEPDELLARIEEACSDPYAESVKKRAEGCAGGRADELAGRESGREKFGGCADKIDMAGLNVLVTAGPTQEAIDPVRYITNHSTGRMGYAFAEVCARRGAFVTLVSGPTVLAVPPCAEYVPVISAADMFREVKSRAAGQDIIIKAAAVADYRPAAVSAEKIKKTDAENTLKLERTDDILGWLGAHRKDGQFLCGFSMETENVLENSRKKLEKKHADMIAANSLKTEGAGFGGNTNVVTVITKDGTVELGKLSKEETADRILDIILQMRTQGRPSD